MFFPCLLRREKRKHAALCMAFCFPRVYVGAAAWSGRTTVGIVDDDDGGNWLSLWDDARAMTVFNAKVD